MKKAAWVLLILAVVLFIAICLGLKNADSRYNVQESYQVDISDFAVQMLPSVFQTNSTRIAVTSAEGQPPVYIYLYYEGETDNIMEFQLDGGETKSFCGLTSYFRYTIGVKAFEADSQSVSLEVEYRPLDK